MVQPTLLITPRTPTGSVGWGDSVQLIAQQIGPIAPGSRWLFQGFNDADQVHQVFLQSLPTQVPDVLFTIGQKDQNFARGTWGVSDNDTIYLQAILEAPDSTVVVSSVLPTPWKTGAQTPMQFQAEPGAALTPAQAQQIDEIHQVSWPILSVDGLRLTDLTDGIPTDFLSAQLPSAVTGVIIRLTQIPDELTKIAADANYWHQTLAVAHIFRGSDLWLRFPVHSSNRMFLFPSSNLVTGIAGNDLTAWLLNMSIQVTFAPGVLGLALLMHTP